MSWAFWPAVERTPSLKVHFPHSLPQDFLRHNTGQWQQRKLCPFKKCTSKQLALHVYNRTCILKVTFSSVSVQLPTMLDKHNYGLIICHCSEGIGIIAHATDRLPWLTTVSEGGWPPWAWGPRSTHIRSKCNVNSINCVFPNSAPTPNLHHTPNTKAGPLDQGVHPPSDNGKDTVKWLPPIRYAIYSCAFILRYKLSAR